MLKVRQIKISVLEDNELILKKKIAKKLHILEKDIIAYKVRKKSIDARDKNNIYFIYEVELNLKKEQDFLKMNKSSDISLLENEDYKIINKGKEKLKSKIYIVGSGPAGLFTALILAENGYKPIIIERG